MALLGLVLGSVRANAQMSPGCEDAPTERCEQLAQISLEAVERYLSKGRCVGRPTSYELLKCGGMPKCSNARPW